ncbi:MAG: pirin family protein [Myxococcales bacterium]|nr:pirin family protein [Myxococcales bacterium]
MSVSRRVFLASGGAASIGALAACRTEGMATPAAVSVTPRRVLTTLAGMATSDGAGVKLTRVIGQPALKNLDPFILLDRLFSDDPSGYVAGFPDHPHRGFETVSIMLDGKIRHKDSRGNQGLITGGGAQWMTAGRGIVHSEMPEQDKGLLSGFQLWVNLPANEKMCPQFYQDLGPEKLAHAALGSGGAVRVISGTINGLAGPVRMRPTDPMLATLALADDKPFEIEVPEGHTAFAFVHAGSVAIGDTVVPDNTLAILSPGNRVRFSARTAPAGVLFAAGRPLREPIVQRGPFVMNTEAEIQKAFADYRAGILDKA